MRRLPDSKALIEQKTAEVGAIEIEKEEDVREYFHIRNQQEKAEVRCVRECVCVCV